MDPTSVLITYSSSSPAGRPTGQVGGPVAWLVGPQAGKEWRPDGRASVCIPNLLDGGVTAAEANQVPHRHSTQE